MPEEKPKEAPAIIRIPCEVYSRVVGYLRPVINWNAGKQQEYKDRVMFDPKKEKNDNSK